MKPSIFLVVLMVLLVAPATAMTVSAENLKWEQVNVKQATTKTVFITENQGEVFVVFQGSVANICTSEPTRIVGDGTFLLTCTAPNGSATGYARISERAGVGQTITTGVRIPIALSSTSSPAVEPTTRAATQTPQQTPTKAQQTAKTISTVKPTPTSLITITAPPASPAEPFSLVYGGAIAASALLFAAVFIIVVVYDRRRARK